ncbi:MAG: Mut7-C RNAse domain-containing protein [Nitrospinaceae bacterium]
MPVCHLRFYEELNDFLPPEKRKTRFAWRVEHPSTIREVIESLGVPVQEVDLILANGESVDFSYRPAGNDAISVYPMFESLDISEVTRLPSRPLRVVRFVLDVHLGKLARYLRMLGFDSLYRNTASGPEIIRLMQAERRIILTRDSQLSRQKTVTHGYWVRADHPRSQAAEIVRRFDLGNSLRPFSRCIVCNGLVAGVEKRTILPRLPHGIRQAYEVFHQCGECGRIYWNGSHARRMAKLIEEIRQRAKVGN